MQPEFSVFRIDEIFDQLQVEFEPLAAEKGLELTFVPSSLAVRSDRRLLRRLLQNLVSNAIKYTLTGRVLVGTRRRGKRLAIQIIDTGLGVPASKQKIIFKEFQRLEQGAKAARGLGLGLSIVERIARILDHKVTLRSASSKGSTFAVELPIATSAPEPRPLRLDAAVPAAPLEGVVVLCIENEPQVLAGMDALLSGWGCQVLGGPGSCGGVRGDSGKRIASGCFADRLSPRRGQWHRCHRRLAPASRRRDARGACHCGPEPGRTRGSARAGHSSFQ